MKSTAVLSVTLFIFTILNISLAQQKCTFSKGDIVPYGQMVTCMLSIPYNASIKAQTMDTVQKALQMYVFRDVAANSPDPKWLPLQVDIFGGLSQINAKNNYKTDYDFQQTLASFLTTLNDPHTQYRKPGCYSSFSFFLPFQIASVFNDTTSSQQIVIISAKYDQTLVGKRINKINNQDAVSYLVNFADTNAPFSLDLGSRFNYAIKSLYTTRSQGTYGIPSQETETFELYDYGTGSTNTITLKWQATAMKDVPDIYQACFTGDRSIRNGSIPYVDSPATILEETEYVKAQLYDDNSYHLPQKQKRATASQKPIYQGENISLFNVGNGVAAMKINSFMPQKYGLDTNDDLKSEPQFLFDLQRSLVLANQLNLGQLILDFRGNGGGYVCLAMQFLRLMFPDSPEYPQHPVFDLIHSNLTLALAQNAAKLPKDVYSIFSPWKYFDYNTGSQYQDLSWILPGNSYYRGNSASKYSNKLQDDCSMLDVPPFDANFVFNPSNIIVLTDGTCGSACALTARNIQETNQGRVVVVGGIANRPQMVASFIGGLVYELQYLLEEMTLLNLMNSPLAPQQFPTNAVLRWALWEQYPWNDLNSKFPAEFVFEPADYRMMYSLETVSDDMALYRNVALQFK
jgi:hypothetical protein